MWISSVQQSDSVIHIHITILFQILFSFRLLHNTKQSSLYYTVGLCWLFILSIAVDLNSLTRDQTQAPSSGSPESKHWTTREFPTRGDFKLRISYKVISKNKKNWWNACIKIIFWKYVLSISFHFSSSTATPPMVPWTQKQSHS